MLEILLAIVAIILYLIYKKLDAIIHLYRSEEEKYEASLGEYESSLSLKGWLKSINRNIYDLSQKTSIIADSSSADYPAGKNSAKNRRKENLVKIYADYLSKNEKLSQKDALTRAKFEIYNFDEEKILDRIDGFFYGGTEAIERNQANDSFYSSGILNTDIEKLLIVDEKGNRAIIPHDLFEPLYELIVKQEWQPEDNLELDRFNEDDNERYSDFVKNRAIIAWLEKLKILSRENNDNWDGHPKYKLKISNLDELRKIIYQGGSSHDNAYFEEKYNEGKLKRLLSKSYF